MRMVINSMGSICTFNDDGNHHSFDDKPAVIYADGEQHWFKHGRRHRDNNLPAVVEPGGIKHWYKYGVFVKRTGYR